MALGGDRILQIVLKAKDDASATLNKVTNQVTDMGGKLGATFKRLGREAMDLLNNRLIQGIGFAGLLGGLMKSIEVSDRYEASLRKLAGTAKITGVPLEELEGIADKARRQFQLSIPQANDFAVEMAKLATKAGDVGKAGPALEAFLEIGAARGLTAAETLKAVQQSILGIDEGTDKLFNANPSVLFKNFADAMGLSVGKMTDTQKAQALLTAALQDGSKVTGSYADFLKSAAGQQELMKIRTEESLAVLGKSMESVRQTVLPILATLATKFGEFITGLQILGVDAAILWESIGPRLKRVLGNILIDFSGFVGSNRVLLTLLGDTATEMADTMGDAGVKMVRGAEQRLRDLTGVQTEMYQQIHGITVAGEKRVTATVVNEGRTRTGEMSESRKKAEAEARLLAKAFGDTITPKVKETENQVKDLGSTLRTEFPQAVGAGVDAVEGLTDALSDAERDAAAYARGLTGIAQGVGLIDDKAAAAIQNVVGLAEGLAAVAKGGLGDPSAVIGMLGGLSGLLKGLFGGDSPAQRAAKLAIQRNTEAIQDNNRRVGDLLTLNTPGAAIGATKRVLESLATQFGDPKSPVKAASFDQLMKAVLKEGLSLTQFREALKDLGLDAFFRSELRPGGGVFHSDIGRALEFLGGLEPTTFGSGFGDQQSRIRRGIGLGAIDPASEFGQLAQALAASGATGITDILGQFDVTTASGRTGALGGLRGLFNNIGSLDASAFGQLTGSEFLDAIEALVSILADPERLISGFDLTPAAAADVFGMSMAFEPMVGALDISAGLLGSIDANIATMAQWFGGGTLQGDGGGFASAGTRVGTINVTVNAGGGGDPAVIASATREATLEALNEALYQSFHDRQLAKGVVVRGVV